MAPKKPKELTLDELRAAVVKIEERIDAESLKMVKLITEAGANGESEEFEEPLALASKHLSYTSGVRSKEMLARRVVDGEHVQSVASELEEGAKPDRFSNATEGKEADTFAKMSDAGATVVAAVDGSKPNRKRQVANINEPARKKAKGDENASGSTAVAADEDAGHIKEQTGVDGKTKTVIDLTGE
ncbi:hypothetical protein LTR16_000007 [Cryomyces antarcticus]|uniref:Uncharacterized protein n=1 Tax=Cryomyces antarcticus TaxID=329879 RepID=A0ABR0KUZ7_9PEZI|nr:hypothetical protein LTR60_000003 [Cryomyces antarcticus]KAK5132127.1 hypothetical protein LTR16_000007 [Cryomyces antarcticus]